MDATFLEDSIRWADGVITGATKVKRKNAPGKIERTVKWDAAIGIARSMLEKRIGTVAREGGRALSPFELDAATLASLLRRALAQAEEHADARAAVRSALAAEACGLDVACRALAPLLRPPEDHEPPPKRARCM